MISFDIPCHIVSTPHTQQTFPSHLWGDWQNYDNNSSEHVYWNFDALHRGAYLHMILTSLQHLQEKYIIRPGWVQYDGMPTYLTGKLLSTMGACQVCTQSCCQQRDPCWPTRISRSWCQPCVYVRMLQDICLMNEDQMPTRPPKKLMRTMGWKPRARRQNVERALTWNYYKGDCYSSLDGCALQLLEWLFFYVHIILSW